MVAVVAFPGMMTQQGCPYHSEGTERVTLCSLLLCSLCMYRNSRVKLWYGTLFREGVAMDRGEWPSPATTSCVGKGWP